MSAFQIAGFAKSGRPLSKRIFLHDGKVVSNGSACIMSSGHALRKVVDGLEPFAKLVGSLDSNEAIALGRLNRDLPDQMKVVTKSKLAELNGDPAQNVIARMAPISPTQQMSRPRPDGG